MSLNLLLSLLLIALNIPVQGSSPPTQPLGNCTRSGIELTEDAFSSEFVNGLQTEVVVYFYKIGCPFCKRFDPTWRCLVDAFSTNNQVVFLKFPASEYPRIANQYSIEGFPTIRYLPKGYRYRPTFLGVDYSQKETLEFDKLASFIHFSLGKSGPQITARVPSENGLNIGKIARGQGIIKNGGVVIDGTKDFESNTKSVSTLYITNIDDTLASCIGQDCIDTKLKQLADNDVLRSQNLPLTNAWPSCINHGTCLSLKSSTHNTKICQPVTLGATDKVGRLNGLHHIFYNCQSIGECNVLFTLSSAPSNTQLTWSHQCSGLPSVGLKIGTTPHGQDVVSPLTGTEQLPWKSPSPTSKVLGAVSTTQLYFEGQGVIRSNIKITVVPPINPTRRGTPNVVNITLEGDFNRDIWAKLSSNNNPRGFSGEDHKYTNVALHKLSSMSSTFEGETGSYGNDGLFDLSIVTGLNAKDPEPYYQIDLGEDIYLSDVIKSIRVFNVGNPKDQFHLMPFWIILFGNDVASDLLPRTIQESLRVAYESKLFTTPLEGTTMYEWIVARNDLHVRHVRVQLVNTRFLTLNEVEVYTLPPNRQCPTELVPPNGDPECLSLPQNNPKPGKAPVSMKIKYRCHRPGVSNIVAEIPMFPKYSPYKPIALEWIKECSNEYNEKLDIGLVSKKFKINQHSKNPEIETEPASIMEDPASIMLNGIPRKGYEAWPDPYSNPAPSYPFLPSPPYNASIQNKELPQTLHVIQGVQTVLPLSMKLSEKGLKQYIRQSIKVWSLTVIDSNRSDATPTQPANENRSVYNEIINEYNIVAYPNIIVKEDSSLNDDGSITSSGFIEENIKESIKESITERKEHKQERNLDRNKQDRSLLLDGSHQSSLRTPPSTPPSTPPDPITIVSGWFVPLRNAIWLLVIFRSSLLIDMSVPAIR